MRSKKPSPVGLRRCVIALMTTAVFAAQGMADNLGTLHGPVFPGASAPGATEIRAMAASYPERIDRAEFKDGEWALLMDDVWYYWADGRLLPETLRGEAQAFVPIRFYSYELGPPRMPVITPERERILQQRTAAQNDGSGDPRRRFNDFLDTLYEISSQPTTDRRVRSIRFLGFSTRVHPILAQPLQKVEREILDRARDDESVSTFVQGLSAVHGYNWRNIAGTPRRSYHSYGVAVDLVPRSYAKRWPYWLWASQSGVKRWWDLPLEARWPVPQAVVDAFETNGFVWGGKWLFFDNLHFEFRPESISMAVERSGS